VTREEFCALPSGLALAMIWDAFPGIAKALADKPVPQLPRPPKYDQAIYRKGGFQWASEMDLPGLLYWRGKYAESAANVESQYAEKDAKKVRQLDFWISWRRTDPTSRWSGERNNERVTADAPRDKPFIYEREPKRDDTYEQAPLDSSTSATFGDASDDIPFASDTCHIDLRARRIPRWQRW
jgi:hypothetical protein